MNCSDRPPITFSMDVDPLVDTFPDRSPPDLAEEPPLDFPQPVSSMAHASVRIVTPVITFFKDFFFILHSLLRL